jgi:GNAT superfamily N-acetyltransferase
VTGPRNVWYLREGRIGERWQVAAHVGNTHPDGAIADQASGDPLLWRTMPSDGALLKVELAPDSVPGMPDLWFVHVDEPRATPRATNLVAFASDDFEPGAIVSKYAFATAGVHNDRQAGAVRWYPSSAIVHQIFVSPDWRRRSVGTVLLYTADAFHQANGWQGHLHSDGRRTDLGQQFIAGVRHPQRFAPLTETMPPMDPS